MVDITNPSLVPSYDPIDLQQQQTSDVETTDVSTTTEPEVEESSSGVIVDAKLAEGDELGLSDEEKRKEKEKKKANEEANLTSRYLKPRRSFNTSALRDQLSQRLQQSSYQQASPQNTSQPSAQTQSTQVTENPEQLDPATTDGFAQLPSNNSQTQTSSNFGGSISQQTTTLPGQQTTSQTNNLGLSNGQPLLNPEQASDNLMAGGKPSVNTDGLVQSSGKPNLANEPGKANSNQTGLSGQTDQLSQPKLTPRQFPSPLGTRPPSLGGTPRQFPSPLGSNNSSLGQQGTLQTNRPGNNLSSPNNPATPGQPSTDSSGIGRPPIFGRPQGLPQGLPQQGQQFPTTNPLPSNLATLGQSGNGQPGTLESSSTNPTVSGKGQGLSQPTLNPALMGMLKTPEGSGNALGVSSSNNPEKTNVLGKDAQSTDALSQANAKGAFGAIVNKPISLFDEKSAFTQPTLAGSDREQVKQALATKYPVFATLPVATQNIIAEVFVNQPDLPLESAETFIQFAETNSFQKLGSNDRTTVVKMLGALMQSPSFNNFNDGRIAQLINDVAGGLVDLQVYRSPSNEPGRSNETGFALNLGSPEVSSALNAALKGDTGKLVNILLNLGKQVPDLQAQDPTWKGLMSQPEFKDLAVGQQEIYQTVKQFPGADAKKLVEYAGLPSAKFLAASPNDRTNELKLVAAVNTTAGEVKESSGETSASGQPTRTTGSGLRLAGLPAGRVDGGGPTQQMPLDKLVQEGTVNVELYRANDGKKNIVEGNNIKLNITDPSVQRSLSTDGKLAAGAVNRFSGVAAQNVDEKIKDLNNKPGFSKLDDETKRLIASALKEHPNANVDELLKFTESPNYTEIPPDKSSREKANMMRMVASLLHQYADNPKQLAMLYNSLQRLFNNDIKFNGFMNDNKYVSNNQSGGVSINSKWVENEKEAAATFVTEVNHALHERPNITWGGTVAFFANEYRAAYTEALFRTNAQVEPEHMRQFMNVLLNTQPSSVYAHIRHTLDTDPVFTNLVSWINEKLDKDEVVKPEELRQTLLGMVGKSPNIPNEAPFEQSWFVDNESPFPDAAAVVAQVSRQLPFDQLSTKEQAILVNLVRKYDADPQVFHQLMQTPKFQESQETDRSWLLRVIGGLSSEASKEGKGSPAHRTLTQIFGGKVEVQFYESETDSRLQHMDKNTLNINLAEGQNLLMDDWVAGLNDSVIESVVGVKK